MDIKKLLKLNGLILAPDASSFLESSLGSSFKSADVVKRFVDCVLSIPCGIEGNRITKSICEKILNDWKTERSASEEVTFLINAFDVPRFSYCRNKRKFIPLRSASDDDLNTLLSFNPKAKSFLFAHRYDIVYQRVIRNQLFADASKGFHLRPVEFLLSSGAKGSVGHEDDSITDDKEASTVIILGVLTQLKNAQWYLEDPSNLVRLDLSQTRFHQGIFSEGSVVLAEGWFDDDSEVFHATGIGLPPVECAVDTRRYFAVTNPFGGGALGIHSPAAVEDSRMARLLSSKADSMVVLLGETRLDASGCLEHLETIFSGYADFPPCAFVLCGNFLSLDTTAAQITEARALLRTLFRHLSEAFLRVYDDAEARGHRQPRLVLVPGPHDPCPGPRGVFPRAALPLDLFGVAPGKRPPDWLWLATNPCRLRVYTREIVVFRYDYGKQLIRHCLHLPTTTTPTEERQNPATERPEIEIETQIDDEVAETSIDRGELESPARQLGRSLARCLASQAHLTPLPLHVSPAFWAFDQALCLCPLPDLVVCVEPDAIADVNVASEAPSGEAEGDPLGGCRFTNPGRFGGGKEYAFKVFYPSNRLVEDSRLPS